MSFTLAMPITRAFKLQPTGVLLRPTRFTSTITNHVRRSTQSTASLNNAFRQNRKLAFAVGGTSIATLGLFLTRRKEDDYPADPRDAKALSMVPLNKLISGWM